MTGRGARAVVAALVAVAALTGCEISSVPVAAPAVTPVSVRGPTAPALGHAAPTSVRGPTVGSPTALARGDSFDPAKAVVALSELAHLAVKAPASMSGYSRMAFGGSWPDVDHNHCDTRDDVLARDLVGVTYRDGSSCVIAAGRLQDPYTGVAIHFVRGVGTSTAVQIDHVVALADAWRTGAQGWSAERRVDFANDPRELLAVDGPENESKGANDASQWLPPNRAFDCAYVAVQVAVKADYDLWVTRSEGEAMREVLSGCAAG